MSANTNKTVVENMVQEALQKISDSRIKPLLQDIALSTSTIQAHQKSIEKNSAEIAKVKAEMEEVSKAMWSAFDTAGA